MKAEELNMDKEMMIYILTSNLNIKKVCAKMFPKIPSVSSQKTNAHATTSCSM
jgi:hypothetical protein